MNRKFTREKGKLTLVRENMSYSGDCRLEEELYAGDTNILSTHSCTFTDDSTHRAVSSPHALLLALPSSVHLP